jgi:hypothetical protein
VSPAPPIEKRCICIADRDAVALAAVISSYLFEQGTYFPLFTFPAVNAPMTEGDDVSSETYLSNAMGGSAATFINNAWARMHGSPYLILAGLSADQISYLSIPQGVEVINVASLTDVHERLRVLSLRERPKLRCKRSDVLRGLFVAQRTEKILEIEEGAGPLPDMDKTKTGIIVVEDDDVGSVVAVNYASSVGANLLVVPKTGKREVREIHRSLQEWKTNGDDTHRRTVENAVTKRINGVSFRDFEYATFFTNGVPYSLVLENVIPCSYVHLSIKPDLFVFNCLAFERIETFHSAVVFSPLFFADEETSWLTEFFKDNNYYLRQLIGQDASFANLDFTLQHFPYSLFHICSHGGEVDGWEVSEEFVDRNGKTHVIEYDEVVGCDVVADKDGRVQVHRKAIFRRLDGLPWMSEELEKEKIPQYVFHDMWKALYPDQRTKLNPNAKRKKKGQIATSCAIRCSDTIHQGELHILASYSSPFVFNNTCWSWYEVASFFLSCGSRGYIGTLWAIDNEGAIIGARTFYDSVFSGTVLSAFHRAVRAIDNTQSKNIYVFWGLHFSTISPARNAQESRREVFAELARAFAGWREHIEGTKSKEGKRNATRVLASLIKELKTNFSAEDLRTFQLQRWARITGTFREGAPAETKKEVPIAARRSLDHVTEYK